MKVIDGNDDLCNKLTAMFSEMGAKKDLTPEELGLQFSHVCEVWSQLYYNGGDCRLTIRL